MPRALAPVAIGLLVLLLPGGGAGASAIPTLSPSDLPALPAQGLAVQAADGVVLVGLDGRVYGMLPRFVIAWDDNRWVKLADLSSSADLGTFQHIDPAVTVLLGPGGTLWRLESGRLRPLPEEHLSLSGGNEIVIAMRGMSLEGEYSVPAIVNPSSGRVLAQPSYGVVGGRLLVSGHVVRDLASGKRYRLRTGSWTLNGGTSSSDGTCTPAGILADGDLAASCAIALAPPTRDNPSSVAVVRSYSISPTGRRVPLDAGVRVTGTGAQQAFLSPDGRLLATTTGIAGCNGGSQAIVGSTTGGAARFVIPAATDSGIGGWTADGRLAVGADSDTCKNMNKPVSIYLVDPSTLARTLVYTAPSSAWGWHVTGATRSWSLWS